MDCRGKETPGRFMETIFNNPFKKRESDFFNKKNPKLAIKFNNGSACSNVMHNEITLSEYSNEVSSCLKHMSDMMYIVGMQRVFKMNQLKEMLEQLRKVVVVFDSLYAVVDETRLLTINSLISASRLGWSGEPFSEVVNQIDHMCAQARNYLVDLKEGIDSTHTTLESVLLMMQTALENELNMITIMKGQADYYIGKLVANEECLMAMNSLAEKSGIDQEELKLFQDRTALEMTHLSSVLFSANRHMVRLLERKNIHIPSSFNVRELIEKLDFLATATISIKNFHAFSGKPEISLF